MPTRILKFGGSSLAGTDQIEIAAARVAETLEQRVRPIVVMSAMGGHTDRLLATARRLHPDPRPEELDRLLATGEMQAASLMAIALHKRGLIARSFTGEEAGIVTDECFGHARILDVKRSPLAAALAAGEIPVVTGFQGCSTEGNVTTLGRGGSDISAVGLGVAHEAERVVFYRDVDGIHSADPKLLAVSYRHDRIDYESMIDLAEAGAPILHPQALEQARAHRLPLEVRSLAGGSASTLIVPATEPATKPVWSISLSHPVSLLTVDPLPRDVDMLARLMAMLDRSDLCIHGDLQPAECNGGVSFHLVLPDSEGPALHAHMEDFLREEPGVRLQLERRRRRVTLVGRGVGSRRVSKAVERVVTRLGPPMATSWGDRHRAFVVPESDGRNWLASLHQELIQP